MEPHEAIQALWLRSNNLDPWWNMALEEALLDNLQDRQVLLFLWHIEPTVMIGAHQNPWHECRCRLLEEEGGKLARRVSGGGTVYQDLGTLNFTFLAHHPDFEMKGQFDIILDAVKHLGIEACFSGRNDLLAEGRKFSGNAVCHRAEASLHHGTLLANSDLERMARYLNPSPEKLVTKGVASVRSRVINLADLRPGLTIDDLTESLVKSFSAYYGEAQEAQPIFPAGEVEHFYAKHASWEWRYGKTPQFSTSFHHRFPWGEVEVGARIEEGRLVEVGVCSDAMEADLIDDLAIALRGLPYHPEVMMESIAALATTPERRERVDDLLAWLRSNPR